MQDRQGEGGGLAGAGLGDAQQVAAGEHAGDGLRLDRGGRGVAFGGQRLEERLGEAEVGKLSQNLCLSDMRHVRARNAVAARQGDVFKGTAPRGGRLYELFRAGTEGRFFDIHTRVQRR